MTLISMINNETTLLAERDRLKSVMASDLSLTPKKRKGDEIVARLLGAKDWNTALAIVRKREAADKLDTITPCQTKACWKCGSEIDVMGYCEDDACPYNDWHQHIEYDILTGDAPNLGSPLVRRVRVAATAHDDAYNFECEFDAAPYFFHHLKAGDLEQTVRDLAEIEWRGDVASDEVALFFEDGGVGNGYNAVKTMFNVADGGGFECEVDPQELAAWVEQYAPDVWKKVDELF